MWLKWITQHYVPLKPPELGFEYVYGKDDGDSLCMGMHNFNWISLAALPAEVQVQQMLCDPRMHWSQAHLWSLSLATCLAEIKSCSTTVDKKFHAQNFFSG